jgi:hypothetical protein
MKDILLTPIFQPGVPVTGTHLRLLQILTLGFSAASILLFLIALPARVDWINRLVARAEPILRAFDVLNPSMPGVLMRIYAGFAIAIEISVIILYCACALLIFRMRPNDWLALLTVAGLTGFALHITPTLNTLMTVDPNFATIGNLFKGIGIGLALVFLYLFPGGFYAPRWVRIFLPLWVIWAIMWVLFPNSSFSFRDPYDVTLSSFLFLMFWWSTGIASQIYRFFKISNAVERQQAKFTTFGATLALLGYFAYIPIREVILTLSQPEPAKIIFELTAPYLYLLIVAGIPITITFSILRYRLWDIDLIIRRTLIYSALTVTLAIIYLGIVVLLQAFFFGWLTRLPAIVLVATTVAVAALVNPLRSRIQRDIDRRFFRKRYDAEKALEAFSAIIRSETDLDQLSTRLVNIVADTIYPSSIQLAIRKPNSSPRYTDE